MRCFCRHNKNTQVNYPYKLYFLNINRRQIKEKKYARYIPLHFSISKEHRKMDERMCYWGSIHKIYACIYLKHLFRLHYMMDYVTYTLTRFIHVGPYFLCVDYNMCIHCINDTCIFSERKQPGQGKVKGFHVNLHYS